MKIYCKNYNCLENKKLEMAVTIYPRKFYIPIGKEDNLYFGECRKKVGFLSVELTGRSARYLEALCSYIEGKGTEITCDRNDCIHNSNKKCQRNEIIVDKLVIDNKVHWICKNCSKSRISGHKDWSQNLNPNGTAKGGHIDDEYAKKLDYDNKISKSFSDHMRQKE